MANSTQKNAKSSFANRIKDGVLWLMGEAFSTVFLPIVTILIVSMLGAIYYLNMVYIKIEINIPAYRWGLSVIIAIALVAWNKKRIDTWLSRMKSYTFEGFIWKFDCSGQVIGPLCPKCKSFVTESANKKQNAFGMINGLEKRYDYHCANPRCDFEHHLSIDLKTLIKKAQSHLVVK